MNLDDMPEILGSLNHTIDFKDRLSPKGKTFFIEGLKAWQSNLENKLGIKLEGWSQSKIAREKALEAEAYTTQPLMHDPEIGPISIIHAQTQIAQVSQVVDFAWGNEVIFDAELYEYLHGLLPQPKFRKMKTVELSDDEDDKILDLESMANSEAAQDVLVADNTCSDSNDCFLGHDSINHVFRLYRLSQFDILEKAEQEMLLCELRATYEDNHLSNYDLKETAVNLDSPEEITEAFNSIYESDLTYVAFKQGESFLHLYHDFQKQLKIQNEKNLDPRNAYNYFVTLRLIHAFESLQILTEESHQSVSYDDLQTQLEDDRYTQFMSFEVYEEYYERKGEETRFSIIHPEDLDKGIGEGQLNPLNYADFTHNRYDVMSLEAKAVFDSFLQKKLDEYAKYLKMPSVDVTRFHDFVAQNQSPVF